MDDTSRDALDGDALVDDAPDRDAPDRHDADRDGPRPEEVALATAAPPTLVPEEAPVLTATPPSSVPEEAATATAPIPAPSEPSPPSAVSPPTLSPEPPQEPLLDPALNSVLDHDGPWSEEDYRTLSAKAVAQGDGRAELIDGALVVGPGPTVASDGVIAHTRAVLDAAVPEGLCVLGAVPVRMGPDCVLVPDVVVVRASAEPVAPEEPLVVADDVLMVAEIIGPEHGAVDRSFKPMVYARSRVPYLLLVDHQLPYGSASMLIGGRYHEYARAEGAEELELGEPFPVRLPLRPA